MNPVTTRPSESADERTFQQVNKLLFAWMALVAVILIGMSAIPAMQSATLAQPTPAPRYAYCTKEWREHQLPLDMRAIFEDWCEHRPGR